MRGNRISLQCVFFHIYWPWNHRTQEDKPEPWWLRKILYYQVSGKYMDILCFIYDWDSPSTSQTSSKEQAAVCFLTGLCRPLQGVQTALAFDTRNSNMACCHLLPLTKPEVYSSWLLGALANVSVHRRQRLFFLHRLKNGSVSLHLALALPPSCSRSPSLSLSLPLSPSLPLSLSPSLPPSLSLSLSLSFSLFIYIHMGLSENSVPLNPMVNDHYPY